MIPRDLDPRTLRWIADGLTKSKERSLRCAEAASKAECDDLANTWRCVAENDRSMARWLRTIATRTETRRSGLDL